MHKYDHDSLLNLTSAIIDLGIAYYFTENVTFGNFAANLLTTWFLNPKTRMNPNMAFGHFIPGVTNGSHGTFIDSHWFPEMLDATRLLSEEVWSAKNAALLQKWFGDFLFWMNTSSFGKEEANETNNHGVWYDVQTLSIALYVGTKDAIIIANDVIKQAPHRRVDIQIKSDGKLPAEDARTKSWSYNNFCLNAFFHLATLTDYINDKMLFLYDMKTLTTMPHIFQQHVNLWTYNSSTGGSIRKTLDWQLPYIQLKKKWPFQQIVPFFPPNCTETMVDQCIATYYWILRKGANVYGYGEYESTIKNLPGVDYSGHRLNLVMPAYKTTK